MTKVQISLTNQETDLIAQRAMILGYDVTKYLKFVVSREALSVAEETPSFPLSLAAEKKALKALREFKIGKTEELRSVDELDNL